MPLPPQHSHLYIPPPLPKGGGATIFITHLYLFLKVLNLYIIHSPLAFIHLSYLYIECTVVQYQHFWT